MTPDNISPFMRQTFTRRANGEVVAPTNVIKNVSAAYNQYMILRQQHIERIAVYAAIDGMANGNPPYDQEDLDAHGLGHAANFNNMKARSTIDRGAQAYWNLANSTESLVRISLAGNYPRVTEFGETMSRHFSDLLKEWEDFAPNYNLQGSQLTKFGICPIFFPNEESPFWEVVDVSRFYIPSQTLVFTSKLSTIAIDSMYTLQDVYDLYANADDDGPWNKEALGNFLMYRAFSMFPQSFGPVLNRMDFERFIASNDLAVNEYFADTVRLTNMFQREYDEKISHYIISPDFFNTGQNKSIEVDRDFLYFFDRQYTRMNEVALIYTASPGEWNIHSSIGIGQKIFAGAQAVNMLDCQVIDTAKMSGTPMLRTSNIGGREASSIRFYPGQFTDIGGAELVQNNLAQGLDQIIGAANYTAAGLENNALNSGDNPEFPDKSQGSLAPAQVRSRDIKELAPLRNAVAHFYNYEDQKYLICFIRMLSAKPKSAGWEFRQEFIARCEEDGVPTELFSVGRKRPNGLPVQFRSVKAARVAGDGSVLARLMGIETMLGLIGGSMSPQEIADVKREVVAATMGVDYIPMFASSEGQGDEVSGGASLARTEDGLMQGGFAPLFSTDNDQAAHADEHMGTATQIVQSVAQQQLSPVDADKVMSLLIPHLGEHINYMQKSPQFYRDTLNNLRDPYSQLLQWAKLNRRNAEAMIQAAMKKQQEDEAATNKVMSEIERKNALAANQIENADRKVSSQIERAKDANENRAEIMREKVAADADVKRLKTNLDAQVKQEATVKGRAQLDLLATPQEELRAQLSGMIGTTPSTVDFE